MTIAPTPAATPLQTTPEIPVSKTEWQYVKNGGNQYAVWNISKLLKDDEDQLDPTKIDRAVHIRKRVSVGMPHDSINYIAGSLAEAANISIAGRFGKSFAEMQVQNRDYYSNQIRAVGEQIKTSHKLATLLYVEGPENIKKLVQTHRITSLAEHGFAASNIPTPEL
ncbi:MAG: hypothetical protein EBR02_03135 [Alphaproteobacteria bacterium]|nr:hypothetical protein [Alphaproteobacteria bacterium]